ARARAVPPRPHRHRGEPLRRARRLDQHRPPDPAEPGRRGGPPRSQPVGPGGRRRRGRGGRPGRRGVVVPGRSPRVLRVPRRVAARARHGPRPGRRGRRRGHRRRRGRAAAPQRRRHLHPRGRPADGAGRDGLLGPGALRHRPGRARHATGRRGARRRPARGGPGDHRRGAGPAPRGGARRAPRGGRRASGPGPRDHRHRRVGQVVAHRRAGAPAPGRPAGQAEGRGPRRRPDPAARRRRAARRPDPDELPRRRPRLLPLAGDPRRARAARHAAGRPHRAQGERRRPRRPRDAGHRAGRRRRRAARRRRALRHDAGLRGRVAAGEDRHARLRRRGGDQQVRAPRGGPGAGRAARRRPPARPQPGGVRLATGGHAGLRHVGRDLRRRRRHRALPAPAGAPRGGGAAGRRRLPPAGHGPPLEHHRPARPAGPGPLPRGGRGHGARLPRLDRAARRGRRAGAAPRAGPRRALRRGRRGGRRPPLRGTPGRARGGPRPARAVAGGRRGVLRRRAGRRRPRPRGPHPAHPGVAVRDPRPARRAASHPRPRRARPFPAPGEPAGVLPVHRRGVRVQARRRGPRPDVRRGRRRRPDEPPLQAAVGGPGGDPALHGVRLGDALRPRPGPASRRLREGRHLRGLDRDAGRRAGAVRRVRPRVAEDVGQHDDQRSRTDGPGVLPQRGDRPAGRRVRSRAPAYARRRRARRTRRTRTGDRARHGPGRHPQGGPGPEHLHLLDRVRAADDGRRPGVVHRARGAQLLLGVDQRLPHRRGGGEPHQPARVHARQRVHLRRGVPRARDGGRRLRAEPVVLLLQRDGPRVLRAGPGRPAHLGGRDEGAVRRRRAVAEAEVPRADLGAVAARPGDGLQRHPHHAAGAHRGLRQRQQPPHQRLRRGGHDPDPGVGTPGAGDPARHQPRVGARGQREPAAGLVRHRGAHRSRRGGRARRVRPDQRARRGARRDGDRLPAGAHPGRVDALRAPQARRVAARRRCQHLPPPARRGPGAGGRRTHDDAEPCHRGREAVTARAGAAVPPRARRGGRGGARAAEGGGGRGRERLRGAHGGGPGVHPAAGHRGLLRGGRGVPPQRL
ncbi:MAG: B12 binding domain / kinase domain / Methylmalonyl-CoA mutase, partial [uncultured Nocardioidaceae bacterium]